MTGLHKDLENKNKNKNTKVKNRTSLNQNKCKSNNHKDELPRPLFWRASGLMETDTVCSKVVHSINVPPNQQMSVAICGDHPDRVRATGS